MVISISHWGMFEIRPTPVIIEMPIGLKLTRKEIEATRRPGETFIMRAIDVLD